MLKTPTFIDYSRGKGREERKRGRKKKSIKKNIEILNIKYTNYFANLIHYKHAMAYNLNNGDHRNS